MRAKCMRRGGARWIESRTAKGEWETFSILCFWLRREATSRTGEELARAVVLSAARARSPARVEGAASCWFEQVEMQLSNYGAWRRLGSGICCSCGSCVPRGRGSATHGLQGGDFKDLRWQSEKMRLAVFWLGA